MPFPSYQPSPSDRSGAVKGPLRRVSASVPSLPAGNPTFWGGGGALSSSPISMDRHGDVRLPVDKARGMRQIRK